MARQCRCSRVSHEGIAMALQLQASTYILMLTIALWFLKFVMSSVWLQWLSPGFGPYSTPCNAWSPTCTLFPICLVLALGVGAFHVVMNNHRGHGWRVILSTLVIAVLGWTVTCDPISELASENGMLTPGPQPRPHRILGSPEQRRDLRWRRGGSNDHPHPAHRRRHRANAVAVVQLRYRRGQHRLL